ncbi:MAG: 1-acyl-sn-glycerol-3-phosphate acyltransferase [Bdellovibrionales bacterium]|nr:1-acyl-sn-glycerol-3-phosphate acyltransferase [Bdellovibrionales bacterium]
MLRIFRLIFAVCIVLNFMLVTSVIHLFSTDVWRERKLLSKVLKAYNKWMLVALGIKINIKGQVNNVQGKLIVCNHMSYLDVFMLAALYPTSYVTSVEMRDTPVLGWLCRLGSCVFVERRNKVNIQNEIKEITQALQKNLTVTIFPEATSTNGDEVIRFRKPLFNAALFAKADVLPICINYRRLDGKEVNKENRDDVCWYGDMSFGPHFLKYFRYSRFEVDIEFLPVIPFSETRDLDTLVNMSHTAVKSAYDRFTPVVETPIGLSEIESVEPLNV